MITIPTKSRWTLAAVLAVISTIVAVLTYAQNLELGNPIYANLDERYHKVADAAQLKEQVVHAGAQIDSMAKSLYSIEKRYLSTDLRVAWADFCHAEPVDKQIMLEQYQQLDDAYYELTGERWMQIRCEDLR